MFHIKLNTKNDHSIVTQNDLRLHDIHLLFLKTHSCWFYW